MNALLTPPPERDLPHHDAIRRQVVAAAIRPRRATRLVPVAAAAGVALVLGAAVAVLAGGGLLPTAVDHGASPTGHTYVDGPLIVRQCLLPPPAPSPGMAPGPPDPTGAQVLAVFPDSIGGLALVGNGRGFATCDLNPDGQVAGAGQVVQNLSPWPRRFDPTRQAVTVDLAAGRMAIVGDRTSSPGAPMVFEVVGRVAPSVTRVVVTWSDGPRLDAAVQDGYYLVRRLAPGQSQIPALAVTVRAYGDRGRLLGVAHGQDPLLSPTPTGPAAVSHSPGR
jgi:hypothetical protein